MLVNLHIKNLALIEEAEIDFQKGLNILTGETGVGKSIIIDSVHFALGQKISKDVVRDNADYALAELVFEMDNDRQLQAVREMDIPVENEVVMQRKIVNGRSISKVNGETVTTGMLQELADILIDIHGQHEHQSLLKKKKHMEVLDSFCGQPVAILIEQVKEYHEQYMKLKNEFSNANIDNTARNKEIILASFEIEEIENAIPVVGEDVSLEQDYRRMVNAKKIMEAINMVHLYTSYDDENGAGESLGRALRELRSIIIYDEKLETMQTELSEIDNLLNDFNRVVADYIDELEFSDEEFQVVEDRLNKINYLKSKYGSSIEEILTYFEAQKKRLQQLQDYDYYLESLEKETEKIKDILFEKSEALSNIRQENAVMLSQQMKEALNDLNFLDARFEIEVRRMHNHFSASGFDEVEFMISTNPGERLKPLEMIASGGEMSRIMLAIKTVLAKKDEIGVLIFDEIDSGISGRTAQKVSEKLALLSGTHQVICVTHLPQIAAMADVHFEITKVTNGEHTLTHVEKLNSTKITEELARMLGGAEITPVVLKNAEEMKKLATHTKEKLFNNRDI